MNQQHAAMFRQPMRVKIKHRRQQTIAGALECVQYAPNPLNSSMPTNAPKDHARRLLRFPLRQIRPLTNGSLRQ